MTVVISIDPIETKNGTPASVTGIDMTSGDPFRGTIEIEGKPKSVRWRYGGGIRDNSPTRDLDLSREELRHLQSVAQKLGARLG